MLFQKKPFMIKIFESVFLSFLNFLWSGEDDFDLRVVALSSQLLVSRSTSSKLTSETSFIKCASRSLSSSVASSSLDSKGLNSQPLFMFSLIFLYFAFGDTVVLSISTHLQALIA